MGPHMGDEAGRPWGQKIGSNDKYNEWKLFIGQVPLEVRTFLFVADLLSNIATVPFRTDWSTVRSGDCFWL